VSLSGGSNIRLVDNDIVCQGAYCDGASGGLVTTSQNLMIFGNRLHDIGCHEDVNYPSSAHPCAWVPAGVMVTTSATSFKFSGVATGVAERDVILVSGQLRRIIQCGAGCLAGTASGLLDLAFSSDLTTASAFQYRDFVPNKQWHNAYFGVSSNSVNFGWNDVNGGTGKACRGLQFSSSGASLYDLHVHDSLIHDTVCDGINFPRSILRRQLSRPSTM
jgi:hypothetical protein